MGRSGKKIKQFKNNSYSRARSKNNPSDFLPTTKEAKEYYNSLTEKHFSKNSIGSRFSEDIDLDDLIKRLPAIDSDQEIWDQDDRDYFKSKGINQFSDTLAYFRVRAKGVSRLVPDTELNQDDLITVKEAKPGFLSFITDKNIETKENEATVIVGKNPTGDTPYQLVTTFPGPPYPPDKSGIDIKKAKEIGLSEGQITLKELKKLIGKDLLLQSG